ncbi:beta-glucan synthesis-associated protein-domain-containing protein [Mycena rosella]|uniref:Beta-glucan synthesis-associated protein-domain-containing protein n=1 Tax=Mycena rosella TaxID=1033263 RepID=A0AAD7GNR1_MYCRO|nr:beta-glucan synthesis-associated protein-domain-containing protein [Mycena rosella]
MEATRVNFVGGNQKPAKLPQKEAICPTERPGSHGAAPDFLVNSEGLKIAWDNLSAYVLAWLLVVAPRCTYSLGPDPAKWGCSLDLEEVDPDDELHRPEIVTGIERGGHPLSLRGATNLGCLFLLTIGILALFIGYPVLTFVTHANVFGSLNLAGPNGTGQIPGIPGNWALIDADTPVDKYTIPSWIPGNEEMQLVFSDEFEVAGRSFYPGDDPYWEAVDLHYWATNNIEWYDPEAITTADGSLIITLSQKETHDLNYEGGEQAGGPVRNKFCFTGGYIEALVRLPGANNILGLWPALWTMGNLGRAGYGASLEGTWPYSYDSCDVGTAPNQTHNGAPEAATVNGDTGHDGELSWLPGQRLSRCTCDGESHPGPKHSDGTFVGRSAPGLSSLSTHHFTLITMLRQRSMCSRHRLIYRRAYNSMFEHVSRSLQNLSPKFLKVPNGLPLMRSASTPHLCLLRLTRFKAYEWNNSSDNMIIPDPTISSLNTFKGSITQQATSVVTSTDPACYEKDGGCFSIYGFEYKPGFDDGYITWISNNTVSWTIKAAGLTADAAVNISARPVPQEPMYIIANLGMSTNFGPVDLAHQPFPVHLAIEYIRVYQPKSAINIGCNPPEFPTSDYINKYIDAYTNPNLTTWRDDFHQPFPKSSFLGEC